MKQAAATRQSKLLSEAAHPGEALLTLPDALAPQTQYIMPHMCIARSEDVDDESVKILVDMGFNSIHVSAALAKTGGDVGQAGKLLVEEVTDAVKRQKTSSAESSGR